MTINENIDFNEFFGHHVVLYGETDTKKTLITAKFIEFLINERNMNPLDISVLDFAPSLFYVNELKIGGKIEDYSNLIDNCRYIEVGENIIPPRLNAKNKGEVLLNACKNLKKTTKLLKLFNENPTSILVINDISIYLHFGDKKFLIETIKKANTFLGNSYYGTKIKTPFAKAFSKREKIRVEFLIKNIEKSYLT